MNLLHVVVHVVLAQTARAALWQPERIEEAVPPWDSDWPNTIAVCAIMKDENPEDIREWLRYHEWLGVNKVLLTDNTSAVSPKPFIQDWIDKGFVEYSTNNVTGMTGQTSTYQKCIDDHRLSFSWIAFFDLDELIVVLDRSATLKSMLREFRFFPGLSIHWLLFGPNEHAKRPEGGGVLQHYTACAGEPRTTVKTFANTYHVKSAATHAHNAAYWHHGVSVNENHHQLELICPVGGESDPKNRKPGPCDASHPTVTRHSAESDDIASIRRIAVFHYITRSWEDYKVKMARRFNIGRAPSFFEGVQQQDQKGIGNPVCSVGLGLYKECCQAHATEDAAFIAQAALGSTTRTTT